MLLPKGWEEACLKSENRLKDFTPIEPINPLLCLQTKCPAAKVLDMATPSGAIIRMVNCQFSHCLLRYPEKKDLKYLR